MKKNMVCFGLFKLSIPSGMLPIDIDALKELSLLTFNSFWDASKKTKIKVKFLIHRLSIPSGMLHVLEHQLTPMFR